MKLDTKSYKHIYYIGYITIKRFGECNNINSVNLLYLKIHLATGHFKEKNGNKYLNLNPTEKYEEVWSGIRSEIRKIIGGKELFYEKDYQEIKVDTDDDFPLNKLLKFPTLAIIVRSVFQEDKKLYPQIYLHEYLYKV